MTSPPPGGWAAKIAALESALADGRLEIEYDDYRVKMRSTDELLKALNYARDQKALELTGGADGAPTCQSFAVFAKD